MTQRSQIKEKKLTKLVSRIEEKEAQRAHTLADSVLEWSAPHRHQSKFAIFTISLKDELNMKAVQGFVGTARKYHYEGDIVLATHPQVHSSIKKYLQKHKVTVYGLDVKCSGQQPHELCSLPSDYGTRSVPIAMLRFYIYQWWAMRYDSGTVIMLSDFRDVFFQSNPFAYKYPECTCDQ